METLLRCCADCGAIYLTDQAACPRLGCAGEMRPTTAAAVAAVVKSAALAPELARQPYSYGSRGVPSLTDLAWHVAARSTALREQAQRLRDQAEALRAAVAAARLRTEV